MRQYKQWCTQDSESYEDVVATPLILALTWLKRHYTVEIDAWETQGGFGLLQGQVEKVLKPIGFLNSYLHDAATRYGSIHKVCSAVV